MTTAESHLPAIDNKVKQVISNIRNLPTPPIVFHQIQKVINDPNCSAAQIAAILAEDPAMSVKVLKLTNSAFYGLSQEVESVKQAVVIVGMEAIKNLVLSASILDMFKGKEFDQEYQEQFWRHSLATAFGSRLLARKLRARGIVDPDTAFSGGLLHDIGKIIMVCFLPKEYAKVREAKAATPLAADHIVEAKVLGYDHAQVGAMLAQQWKLPHKLTEAIVHHHCPENSAPEDSIAYVVHIANYVSRLTFLDRSEQAQFGKMTDHVMSHMVITEEHVEQFCTDLREEYVKAETFMKMAGIS
jgi:putative nucleotidyltransferase with HDIG domain